MARSVSCAKLALPCLSPPARYPKTFALGPSQLLKLAPCLPRVCGLRDIGLPVRDTLNGHVVRSDNAGERVEEGRAGQEAHVAELDGASCEDHGHGFARAVQAVGLDAVAALRDDVRLRVGVRGHGLGQGHAGVFGQALLLRRRRNGDREQRGNDKGQLHVGAREGVRKTAARVDAQRRKKVTAARSCCSLRWARKGSAAGLGS